MAVEHVDAEDLLFIVIAAAALGESDWKRRESESGESEHICRTVNDGGRNNQQRSMVSCRKQQEGKRYRFYRVYSRIACGYPLERYCTHALPMTFAVDFAAAGSAISFAVRDCISMSAIHEVESRMDVAGRNSAVECRSAQAWIACCLSGLVAYRK
jgi:hypothetical protein